MAVAPWGGDKKKKYIIYKHIITVKVKTVDFVHLYSLKDLKSLIILNTKYTIRSLRRGMSLLFTLCKTVLANLLIKIIV